LEENRIFLVKNIKNDDYVIPNNNIILSEIERVLSFGLSDMVTENFKRNMNIMDKVLDKTKDYIKDPNDLSEVPVFHAIYNYLNHLRDVTNGWSVNTSLVEASKNLVQLDLENLFSVKRSNKILQLLTIGKIGIKSLNEINKITEVYYGSAHAESSYGSTDLAKFMGGNMDIALLGFKTIIKKEYAVKVSAADA